MNGIHDLGGMHGLGKILHTPDEPTFHAGWEGRVFAMFLAVSGVGHMNLDEFRHAQERMNPAEYLSRSYYEHWMHALEDLLDQKRIVSTADLDARLAQMRGAEACQSS